MTDPIAIIIIIKKRSECAFKFSVFDNESILAFSNSNSSYFETSPAGSPVSLRSTRAIKASSSSVRIIFAPPAIKNCRISLAICSFSARATSMPV